MSRENLFIDVETPLLNRERLWLYFSPKKKGRKPFIPYSDRLHMTTACAGINRQNKK